MTIEIRPPAEDELRPAMEAAEAAFGSEVEDHDWERERKLLPPSRALAAYDGERPVGFAAAYAFDLSIPGGELPCAGVIPLSTTLDHVGPLARSVADASLLFQAMKSSNVHGIAPAGGGLTFGVPRQYFFDRLEPGVRQSVDLAIARVIDAGYTVRDTTISGAEYTPDVYLHICLPEASCHHAATLTEHADKYSPGVRLRLEMGSYILAEDYVRAMRLRAELTAAVARALERCDALLLPTMPIPAPKIGATTVDVDGVEAPVRATMLSRTQLFNITGHPAIALPAGKGPEGLPRSIQVVGHRGRTERLLDIAAALEDIIH